MNQWSKPRTGPAEARAFAITPPQIVGPFYPVTECPDLASDLARPSGSTAEAQGQLIYVSGRVLASSGGPVPHARIDIWQANAAGSRHRRYAQADLAHSAQRDCRAQGRCSHQH